MYTKDANELAAEDERRARAPLSSEAAAERASEPLSPPSTLSIWHSPDDMMNGHDPALQSAHVRVSLRTAPGMIVSYDENGDAEVYCLAPGNYLNIVPDREGE